MCGWVMGIAMGWLGLVIEYFAGMAKELKHSNQQGQPAVPQNKVFVSHPRPEKQARVCGTCVDAERRDYFRTGISSASKKQGSALAWDIWVLLESYRLKKSRSAHGQSVTRKIS